jgi:hypothetical protein
MSAANSFQVLAGNGTLSPPAALPAAASPVTAFPEGAAKRKKDVKLSKNIMGLKFMQRSSAKSSAPQAAPAAVAQQQQVCHVASVRNAACCLLLLLRSVVQDPS